MVLQQNLRGPALRKRLYSPLPGNRRVIVNNTDGDVLNIDLDIVQETITTSAHYEVTAAEAAIYLILRPFTPATVSTLLSPSTFTDKCQSPLTSRPTSLSLASCRAYAVMARPLTSSSTTCIGYICGMTTVWSLTRSPRTGSFLQARQDRRRCHNRQHPEDILFVVSQPSNGASSDSGPSRTASLTP
jgi:hypothetical protein